MSAQVIRLFGDELGHAVCERDDRLDHHDALYAPEGVLKSRDEEGDNSREGRRRQQ